MGPSPSYTTSRDTIRAMALRGRVSPLERALIEAGALRYSRDLKADRAALDAAYADAMIAAAGRFPHDDDVAVLAAEAAMDTSPWNYWESDKKTPIGRSGDAVRLVEGVVRRNPSHVQATHLYVHLLESSDPQRAEAAADRLSVPSVPTAGHLVHMPGHIYERLGRHADSIRVNIAAARADEAFIRSSNDHSLVRYGYYPLNIHFIVTSAQMAGDMHTAVREAQRLRTVLDAETSAKIAWIQVIDAAPFLAMAQFARPATILAMPVPDARLPYAAAMRHFARAIAHSQLGDQTGFDAELSAIAQLKDSNAFAGMIEQGVPAPDLLTLAEVVARGKHATSQRRYTEAVATFARPPQSRPASHTKSQRTGTIPSESLSAQRCFSPVITARQARHSVQPWCRPPTTAGYSTDLPAARRRKGTSSKPLQQSGHSPRLGWATEAGLTWSASDRRYQCPDDIEEGYSALWRTPPTKSSFAVTNAIIETGRSFIRRRPPPDDHCTTTRISLKFCRSV